MFRVVGAIVVTAFFCYGLAKFITLHVVDDKPD